MSTNSEAVKRWRNSTKIRIVKSMGGKCQCCGYSKTMEALELHHIDPNAKEMGFGAIRANPKSWIKIVSELRKCILVCANCHREIHAGVTQLPETYQTFDETYLDYKDTAPKTPCPVCGKLKPERQQTCSRSCGSHVTRINWDGIDLKRELELKSKSQIARELGISPQSIRKRAKKLGLIT